MKQAVMPSPGMIEFRDVEKPIPQNAIQLNELITHRFPFDSYLDAYHAIDASQGEYLKVMIGLD